MLVLLVRHAQAAEQDAEAFPDDTERPLVPKGRRVQRQMSRVLVKKGLVPDRVYSSPWTRAGQTARILIRETGLPKEQRLRADTLAMPPDVPAIATEIGDVGPEETIALVGHEPWMSGLAGLLLSGDSALPRMDFPKSGIMGIELERLEAGTGTLRCFLVP